MNIRFVVSILAFGSVLLTPISARSVPLVDVVDDRTLAVVAVKDTPALLRGWDMAPISTTWNDPQVVKFLSPMRVRLKVDMWDEQCKEATGMKLRELLGLVKGEALLACPSFDFGQVEQMELPPFLAVLEVRGQGAKIEKILKETAVKHSLVEETETYDGVTVHLREVSGRKTSADDAAGTPATIAWALVDDVFLVGTEKDRVIATIDAIKQGGLSTSLGRSEGFQRAQTHVADAQAMAFVNFAAIVPRAREVVQAKKAESANQPNPMGIDPEMVFDALGLDALNDAFVAWTFGEKEARMYSGLTYSEEKGVLKLLAYQTGSPVQPDWVPSTWHGVKTARFSIPNAYAGLEEMVEAISPMIYGMAQGQLRAFDKNVGFNLKRDFIGSLGNELVTAYAIPPGLNAGEVPPWPQMDQFLSISLVNPEAFATSVSALKKLMGPAGDQMFNEREYLGTKIYTSKNSGGALGEPGPRGFSYAIANQTLLVGIGSPNTVEVVLQAMSNGTGGFWKKDEVKAALVGLPADAVAVDVQDMKVVLASLIEWAVQFQEAADASGESDMGDVEYFDVGERPDVDAISRHWGISAGWALRTSEGLFGTNRIAYPNK